MSTTRKSLRRCKLLARHSSACRLNLSSIACSRIKDKYVEIVGPYNRLRYPAVVQSVDDLKAEICMEINADASHRPQPTHRLLVVVVLQDIYHAVMRISKHLRPKHTDFKVMRKLLHAIFNELKWIEGRAAIGNLPHSAHRPGRAALAADARDRLFAVCGLF